MTAELSVVDFQAEKTTEEPIVKLFGPLRVHPQRQLPKNYRVLSMMALLALNANMRVSTEQIVDELWEYDPPDSAISSIQGYIMETRRIPLEIKTVHRGYMLCIDPDDVDALRFIKLTKAQTGAEQNPQRTYNALKKLLSLGPHRFLEDIECGAKLREWKLQVQDYRYTTLLSYFQVALRLEKHDEVLNDMWETWRSYPTKESFAIQLMLTLYRTCQKADVSTVYRDTREFLREEHGIDVGPQMKLVFNRILNDDPALLRPDWTIAQLEF